MNQFFKQLLSRRDLLRVGLGGLTGLAGIGAIAQAQESPPQQQMAPEHGAQVMQLVGSVDPENNGFDPMQILVDWDYGTVSTLPSGQTLREYEIVAFDKEIEIAPGIFFPAWTYAGRVPGPTLRCTEGDRIRIRFINAGTHPHTIHFHGIHTAEMDGVPGAGPGEIGVGETFTYEFDA